MGAARGFFEVALLLGSILVGSPGWTENTKAKIFESESESKLLFQFSRTETPLPSGETEIKGVYLDSDGNEVVSEKLLIKEGEVLNYSMEQKQLEDRGSMEVKEGRIHFSYTKKEGKEKTASEKLEQPFLVGPTLGYHLKKNWAKIMGGEKFKVRWGVFDRLETVGFEFFKEREEKWKERDTVVVKMKPSNWFISTLVKPLLFRMSADGQKVLAIEGRTIPKLKKEGSWKDLDGFTLYE